MAGLAEAGAGSMVVVDTGAGVGVGAHQEGISRASLS